MKNKKLISLSLIFLMSASILSGCTEKEIQNISQESNQTQNTDEDYKNYVYNGTSVLKTSSYDTTLIPYEDGFYNLSLEYDEVEDEGVLFEEEALDETENTDRIIPDEEPDWSTDYTITFYDSNLKEKDKITFTGSSDEYGQLLFIDSDKNLYFESSSYIEDEFVTSILKTDSTGAKIYSTPFVQENNEYGSYLRNLFTFKDDLYAVDGNSYLYKINSQTGEISEKVYQPETKGYADYFAFDDDIYVLDNDFENGTKIGKLDDTFKVQDITIDIPKDTYDFKKGTSVNLIAKCGDCLYDINLLDATCNKKIDFIQSDINSSDLIDIVQVNDNFYMTFNEDEGTNTYLYTKVDPSNVKEKQIITVGCYFLPYQLRKNIIKFNKESENIRIVVEDYGNNGIILYDKNGNEESGLELLDKDIISGKVPDILILSDYNRINNYAKKGLFVDLNTMFTDANSFPISDLSENIVKLFSTDNKLYVLPISYDINAFTMKKSVQENLNPYTVETVEKFVKDNNITESDFLGFMLRDYALENTVQGTGDKFINLKDGTCSLDNDEFKQLLTFLKNLPISEDVYNESYEYEDESAFFRENRYILSQLYLSNVNDYIREKYGKFGEDITISSMPSCENVVAISPDYLVALTNSENKDNSFEFVKYLFSKETQSSNEIYNFPVNKSSLDTKLQKESKGTFYMEDGKEVYYDESYYIGDAEIKLPKPTANDIKEVKDILENINYIKASDENLYNILNEELSAFYSGQKSVDEVANIMQSRVSIYLAEKK